MLPESKLQSYATPYKNLAVSSTGILVKGNQTELHYLNIGNTNSSVVYLKLYNKATAPTVGTDIPVYTYLLPASSVYAEQNVDPAYFPLGLGIAVTTTSADNSSTAPSSALVINLRYK